MKAVIGLPSLNEADSIANAARECVAHLLEVARASDVVIVNADSGSNDGTPEIFSALDLPVPTAILPRNGLGKGANVRALAAFTLDHGYDALILCDTDVSGLDLAWMQAVWNALNAGHDAVYSRRPPRWNSGDLTYHLCYPALLACTGARIREPISPTQAYGSRHLAAALAQPWPAWAQGFGVDFLMAWTAARLDWIEVMLPRRLNNKMRSFSSTPSSLTSNAKFREVLDAVRALALSQIGKNKVRETTYGLHAAVDPVNFDADYEALLLKTRAPIAALLGDEVLAGGAWSGVTWETWRSVLVEWLTKPESALTSHDMEVLLLGRCAGFYAEGFGRADWYDLVEMQALDLWGTIGGAQVGSAGA